MPASFSANAATVPRLVGWACFRACDRIAVRDRPPNGMPRGIWCAFRPSRSLILETSYGLCDFLCCWHIVLLD